MDAGGQVKLSLILWNPSGGMHVQRKLVGRAGPAPQVGD